MQDYHKHKFHKQKAAKGKEDTDEELVDNEAESSSEDENGYESSESVIFSLESDSEVYSDDQVKVESVEGHTGARAG
jgi:hypothetical protein